MRLLLVDYVDFILDLHYYISVPLLIKPLIHDMYIYVGALLCTNELCFLIKGVGENLGSSRAFHYCVLAWWCQGCELYFPSGRQNILRIFNTK